MTFESFAASGTVQTRTSSKSIPRFNIVTLRKPGEDDNQNIFTSSANAVVKLNGGGNHLVISDGTLLTQRPVIGLGTKRFLGPRHYPNFEGLIATFRSRALIHVGKNPPTFERGVIIPGLTHNWWHWLIDVLPKAFLAKWSGEEWSNWPLILRSPKVENPSVGQTIDMVLDRSTIQWAPASFFRTEQAILWSGSTHLRVEQLAPYRKLLREKALSFPFRAGSERIFIKRSSRLSRRYNQPDLCLIAEQMGFQTIDPEEVSLQELWGQLSRARIIIGPQSAGWANTIVCPDGAVGLQWAAGALRRGFPELAELCRMDVRTMTIDGEFDGDYRVDIGVFQRELEEVIHLAEQ